MNDILELNGVCKSFPGFKLKDINMSLPKGYIMGFAGPNGSGKTTTIRLILNMLERDSGEIRVFGRDNIKNERAVKEDIGVVFDTVFYADTWTVADTGKAVSIFYENWSRAAFKKMTKDFGLPAYKKVSELSYGMRMKLMLACAFSHDAKLLLLDEPTSGLDPVSRDEFLEILQEYIKDGERSVLFSTHITSDLEKVADYIALINRGGLTFNGSMENLIESYRLIKGRISDLTAELEKNVIGLRKTDMNFEALIETNKTPQFKNYIFDSASVDDIVIFLNKGGRTQ